MDQSQSGERTLRVLFVGLHYDYGVPESGHSFEYVNFFQTLARLPGVEARIFAFDEVLRQFGRSAMNQQLLDTARAFQPDLIFFILFTDEIESATIQTLSASSAITLNWFCDDHWRFENFSRFYAPLFHWVVTTDRDSVERYHALGIHSVIRSQWACNHHIYTPREAEPEQLTFVGQAYPTRHRVINALARRNVKVSCYGKGWEKGRISQQRMIEIFSSSTINLNFTESSVNRGVKQFAKILLKRRADGSIHLNSIPEIRGSLKFSRGAYRPQIKGRNFEIPGTGGFLLTQYVEGLEEYYTPGKEVEVFRSIDDLIEKIEYYSSHDSERNTIRQAGYDRTIREHTFEQRFFNLFKKIGLR